ncbi:hypothetical protein BH09ACT11_BH09ACT11_07550 [soil metagenome]
MAIALLTAAVIAIAVFAVAQASTDVAFVLAGILPLACAIVGLVLSRSERYRRVGWSLLVGAILGFALLVVSVIAFANWLSERTA